MGMLSNRGKEDKEIYMPGQAARLQNRQAQSSPQSGVCGTMQVSLEAASHRGLPVQDIAPWVLFKGSEENREECGAVLNACADSACS